MRLRNGPALARSGSPSAVLAIRNTSVAPSVAATTTSAVPSRLPNMKPPAMVRTAPPGTESAIAAA